MRLSPATNLLRNIIFAGHVVEKSADVRKQILISSMFSLISICLLFLFGIDGFLAGRTMLATVVLSFAVINGFNYLYLCQSGNHRISSMVIVVVMSLLAFYLLCTGGSNNTGPLWFYILPSLIFYILGLHRGAVMLGALLCLSVGILYIPGHPLLMTTYDGAFVHRFIGSLFSVSVIAWAYEYSKEDGRRELLSLSRRLNDLSRRDELTGLANRRDMLERIQREIDRHERNSLPFSIIIADIDHFKQINDTYGHECGDNMLRLIGETLTANVQKRDLVSRWGGEELLILLPETDLVRAHAIAERLRKIIGMTRLTCGEAQVGVTLSLGVTEFSGELSISEFVSLADSYMYLAKSAGRDTIYSPLGKSMPV